MPVKWTTRKKWANSQKGTIKQNQEKTENINGPIKSTKIEFLI